MNEDNIESIRMDALIRVAAEDPNFKRRLDKLAVLEEERVTAAIANSEAQEKRDELRLGLQRSQERRYFFFGWSNLIANIFLVGFLAALLFKA